MAHHQVERRKELKQRRKRRKERLKEIRKGAPAQLKTAPQISRIIPNEPDTIALDLTNSRRKFLSLGEEALERIHSYSELIPFLPEKVTTKEIWSSIPERLKKEIAQRAEYIHSIKSYVGAGDWDGSFKQALTIMMSGKIPRGFARTIVFDHAV